MRTRCWIGEAVAPEGTTVIVSDRLKMVPAVSMACTVSRWLPAAMTKSVVTVVPGVSYLLAPSIYTCISLTAAAVSVEAASICTEEGTVAPLAGLQMVTDGELPPGVH